ncbi:hypothetical protein [Nonomuraea longicatena]|uniref:Uncharacterized protein n=1 Tax=Nonomuraea longicatena TaxID=83682 RepID=A0ABN1PWD8_9ACTN
MFARRERDPGRRRDVYVVDTEAWYHSIVVSSRQALEAAEFAIAAARTPGIDRSAAERLARGGAFMERITLDMIESADRWRALLT